MLIEYCGWIAAFMFAFCGLPQARACYIQGHAEGLDKLFIWMWLVGEILYQVYVIGKHGFDYPLLINYWFNTVIVLFIMRYVYWPRGEQNVKT